MNNITHTTSTYLEGMEVFLNFAITHGAVTGQIVCLCQKCKLKKWYSPDTVKDHLIIY